MSKLSTILLSVVLGSLSGPVFYFTRMLGLIRGSDPDFLWWLIPFIVSVIIVMVVFFLILDLKRQDMLVKGILFIVLYNIMNWVSFMVSWLVSGDGM